MAWAEKRGNVWVGYYREPGKPRKIRAGSAKTKLAAERLGQDQEAKIRGGLWHDPTAGSMTFSQYFEQHWLPNKIVEVQTAQQYLAHYDKYLKPAFGSTPLNKITFAQVDRWVISLRKRTGAEELSSVHIRNIFTTLNTCLGGQRAVSAVRDGLLPSSPCRGPHGEKIELPPKDEREAHEVYEVEEVEALMEAMPVWWRPIPIFLSQTGMRWGEMLGLQVNDFEPGYTHVTIKRTIERCTAKAAVRLGVEAGYRVKPRPKNRKARKIALDPEISTLVARMVQERELFPMDRLFSARGANGKPKRTEQWPNGQPISNGSFRTQVWLPAHVKAGIEPRKIHSLRASHITWLFDGGAVSGAVMRRVGHSHLSTTEAYLGRMKDEDERVLSALATTMSRRTSA